MKTALSVPNDVAAETRRIACRAREASRSLVTLGQTQRNATLQAMAAAVAQNTQSLLAANAEDLRLAQAFSGSEALTPSTLARLKLTEGKLAEMVEGIRSVAALPDPLGRLLEATELDDEDPAELVTRAAASGKGLHLEKISVPLGVLAVIFEARPDAVTQIAALALKSGNAAILKPGREVEHTATALIDLLRATLRQQNISEDALTLVVGREEVRTLLAAHDLIDMVIPRGSKSLVEFVQNNTRIPVLGHSEGVCHIYVDRAADPALALRVIADAKLDYPAACNAVETVLLHAEIAPTLVPPLIAALAAQGVRLHADAAIRALAPTRTEPVADWHTEFGTPELALGIVPSLTAAIAHIHTHGSAHTESILTEDPAAADRFLREVDAAGVFHNVSTRFADGFRYGFGAEVGVSTSKFHARGPVGLTGLTTYKYLLRGHGHIAGDYRGSRARAFTHRRAV